MLKGNETNYNNIKLNENKEINYEVDNLDVALYENGKYLVKN